MMQKLSVRKNVNMSSDIANWIETKSAEIGMTQSSIILMCIAEYIKTQEVIKSMGNLPDIMSELKIIQKNQAALQAEAPRPVVETK